MRQHGTGRACYATRSTPACEDCKQARRDYMLGYRATPKGQKVNQVSCARYRTTAKGQLALVRWCANKRGT